MMDDTPTPAPVDSASHENGTSNAQRPLSISGQQSSEGSGFDGSIPSFASECNPNIEVALPSGVTQHQATNSDQGRSEMVVTPLQKLQPRPHRPPGTWQINKAVSSKYSELMDNFSNLMVLTHDELNNNSVPVKPFTVYLMGIQCNMKFGVGSKDCVKLTGTDDWTEMFDKLSEKKAWDCLNYELLRTIVNRYLGTAASLKEQLDSYDDRVREFIDTTTLLEFLDIYKDLFPDDSNLAEGCELLKVELAGNLETKTVADYHQIRGFLSGQFRLHHHILRLAVANEGCLVIFWYVPTCQVSHIVKTCNELQPDFGQAGIIEICIGQTVLYQAKNILDIVQKVETEPVSDVMFDYDKLWKESIEKPKEFWSRMASKTLVWKEPFTKEKILDQCQIAQGKIHWFDGKLNASVNCLDRHAESTPHKVAIIWEKNDGSSVKVTYRKLLEMTCQIAHVLKSKGVAKGNVVLIYMPCSPKAVAAMFACTRIGAIHSVAYAVLKSNELEARIRDANVKCVITSDVAEVGNREYLLKQNVDKAWSSISLRSGNKYGSTKSLNFISESSTSSLAPLFELQRSLSSGASYDDEEESCAKEGVKPKAEFVVLVSGSRFSSLGLDRGKEEFSLEEEMAKHPTTFEPEYVDAEDTMFIMYTSGTTPATTPTGIKHCTAGYLLYVALTHQYVFDYKLGDVFGCMADLGWITGHSYVVYGPLCNGATTVLFEGTATYPNEDRYWKAISTHKINQFYVTPYVISQLMKLPDASDYRQKYDLCSLRTIATVGEPLSGHVLDWFFKNIGHEGCKFVDTWWQTETGGVALIVDHERKDLPAGNFPAKPFFGVDPVIIDPTSHGKLYGASTPGFLCLRKPLPGMGRGVTEICTKNFEEVYFQFKGYGFFTHDLALESETGGYRITGRLNNAIRIQGMWLDVASIEEQMNQSDKRIVKTALVGIPDKHVSADPYDYEGACVFLECNSTNEQVKKQVLSNVMKTISNLLPTETVHGIFPGILVLFVQEWIATYSGKIIVPIYQRLVDTMSQLWLCRRSSSELSFDLFCSQHCDIYVGV